MQRIAYKNTSGVTIPPFGIFQLNGPGTVVTLSDGSTSFQFNAVACGNGNGPYCIDDGQGTVSGTTGQCFRAVEGAAWVSYGCSGPPADWAKVGPIIGQFYVSTYGDGFWYAGQYDATNKRILVMCSNWNVTATNCMASSSSNSATSNSGSGGSVSGSSSSSSPCGCVTVLADVNCSGNSLVKTYTSARGCC